MPDPTITAARRAEILTQLNSLPVDETSTQRRQELLKELNGLSDRLQNIRGTTTTGNLNNRTSNNTQQDTEIDPDLKRAKAILASIPQVQSLNSETKSAESESANNMLILGMAGEAMITAAASQEGGEEKPQVVAQASGIKDIAIAAIQENNARIKDNKKKAENGINLINPNK